MQSPLMPILIAFIAGISLGNVSEIPDFSILSSTAVVLFFLLIAKRRQWKVVFVFCLMTATFSLGVADMNIYLHPPLQSTDISSAINQEKITVEGVICENPKRSPENTELIVSVSRIIRNHETIHAKGLIRLSVEETPYVFKYGDYLRFRTKLKAPHNFNNPGGFDYEKSLLYRGIKTQGFIAGASDIIVIRENQGNPFKQSLEGFRTTLKNFIYDHSSSPQGEIIQAMVLGEQKEIPQEIRDKFNQTNTSHILAISGFHVSIIALIFIAIFRFVIKRFEYLLLKLNLLKVSTLMACIPVLLYAFIAGLGVSVVRATIMILTFLIAILLDKDRDFFNTLALAALIILVIAPYSLFNISFQLSFVAVASILYITPTFISFRPEITGLETKHVLFFKKVSHIILLFIVTSAAATLGTLPLVAFYFNRVSTIGFIANMAVVPILGMLALPIALATIVAMPISQMIAVSLVKISSFLVSISISIIDFFASIPGASFFITTPTLPEIAVYYLLLMAIVKRISLIGKKADESASSRKPSSSFWCGIIIAVCVIFFIADRIYLYWKDQDAGNLQVTFIDVGQGNAALIQCPQGKNILIDGGGFPESSFDVGKYVVAPFLWHERIKNVDTVILTHPHPDHLNGLIFILKNFNICEVWSNGQNSTAPSYRAFTETLKEKHITHRIVSGKMAPLNMNGVTVRILNPPGYFNSVVDNSQTYDFTNDSSLVVKMTFGRVGFLFPADISCRSEARLLKENQNMVSQVLLVPHHGGFMSSSLPFLQHVYPRIAVISCGKTNIYHFPHPDIITRYQKMGAMILRTDLNGAITITTDGTNINHRVQ
jgi:competence protein ComEC